MFFNLSLSLFVFSYGTSVAPGVAFVWIFFLLRIALGCSVSCEFSFCSEILMRNIYLYSVRTRLNLDRVLHLRRVRTVNAPDPLFRICSDRTNPARIGSAWGTPVMRIVVIHLHYVTELPRLAKIWITVKAWNQHFSFCFSFRV